MNIPTNPYPYIIASYAIATALIFGYAGFMIREKKRLKKYLELSKK